MVIGPRRDVTNGIQMLLKLHTGLEVDITRHSDVCGIPWLQAVC